VYGPPIISARTDDGAGNFTLATNVLAAETIRGAVVIQNGIAATSFTGATSRARANSESFYDYFFFDYTAVGAETPHNITWSESGASFNSAGCGVSHN
jgi:hypothetical protein